MIVRHTRDYREARKESYPDVGDALDALMKYFAAQESIPPELQAWVDACLAVKNRYPKPE